MKIELEQAVKPKARLRSFMHSMSHVHVGLAILLSGIFVAVALGFLAIGGRYEIASTGVQYGDYHLVAYRLDKLTGTVAVCLTTPEIDSNSSLVRLSMDCSGRYRAAVYSAPAGLHRDGGTGG